MTRLDRISTTFEFDVDEFVARFEQYLNRDSDHGCGTRPLSKELNDFPINFAGLDRGVKIETIRFARR